MAASEVWHRASQPKGYSVLFLLNGLIFVASFAIISASLAVTAQPALIVLTNILRSVRFAHGPVAQLVRAPHCHCGGRRFEPGRDRQSKQTMTNGLSTKKDTYYYKKCLFCFILTELELTISKKFHDLL